MSECKTVTLRTRPLKNGMLSFYLDYYPGYRDQETYNPQIQISVVSGTKRSIFRQKNKTKRSKKKAAHNTYKAGAKG